MNQAKLFKKIRFAIAIITFCLAVLWLIYLLNNKIDQIDIVTVISMIEKRWILFLATVLLMPFNWILELTKWRYFTKRIQYLSFYQAIISILSGVLVGLFTPSRIGELGGRLVYIESSNRIKALYINGMCSIAQSLITFLMGLISIVVLYESLIPVVTISEEFLYLICAFTFITTITIYFTTNVFNIIISFLNRKLSNVVTFGSFSFTIKDKLKLLMISLLRYLVFCFQFVFLLFVFSTDLSIIDAFFSASLIFFLTTLVPSGSISSLPIRTSFAYFMLEIQGVEGLPGVFASAILWLINLFIPAMFGLISVREMGNLFSKRIK